MIQNRLAKAGRPVELGAIEQFALGIDAEPTVVAAPHADSVEVFERESDRIHHGVTARAGWILAMLFHALADRSRLAVVSGFLQRWDIWRRRWRRRAQQN